MNRRSLLAAGLSAVFLPRASSARAAPKVLELPDHELLDLRIPSPRSPSQRATVLVPKHLPAGSKAPVLVLLHGLGETSDERLGAYAWIERYGLASAYHRLRNPPVASISARKHLTDARADEINTSLRTCPLDGLILVCPFTPNVFNLPHHSGPAGALDQLTKWIVESLLPEVRAKTPALEQPSSTGIDGCSLGGYVSFEVFLRAPQAFGSCGAVQGALAKASAVRYAKRFSEALKLGPLQRVHLETSSWDPYREAMESLSHAFTRLAVPHDLRVAPGSHDQPWLRDVGTLEMLLWHDRVLHSAAPSAPPSHPRDMCAPRH